MHAMISTAYRLDEIIAIIFDMISDTMQRAHRVCATDALARMNEEWCNTEKTGERIIVSRIEIMSLRSQC